MQRRVVVSGRVQAVFFRVSAQEVALSLGLVGWVRNLPDGRVEMVAEGADAAVEQLVTWARTGPPTAHVTGVELSDASPTGLSTFEIR